MALTKCAMGHIYDSDQYASCPYCNNPQPVIDLGGGMPPIGSQPPADSFGAAMPGYVPVGSCGATMPGYVPVEDAGKTMPPMGYAPPAGKSVTDDNATQAPRGYQAAQRVTDDNKTVAMMGDSQGNALVVGWLVCIEGQDKGKDFRIYAKNNTIGRNSSGVQNDVALSDPHVSSRHASLGYDARNNVYVLIPQANSNTIYLNNSAVFESRQLNAYDLIEFGTLKMLFIPLCNDHFRWEV